MKTRTIIYILILVLIIMAVTSKYNTYDSPVGGTSINLDNLYAVIAGMSVNDPRYACIKNFIGKLNLNQQSIEAIANTTGTTMSDQRIYDLLFADMPLNKTTADDTLYYCLDKQLIYKNQEECDICGKLDTLLKRSQSV